MLVRPVLRSPRRRRPVPFTSEWVQDRAAPRRCRAVAVPAWVPGERRLAALLVLLAAAGVALTGG